MLVINWEIYNIKNSPVSTIKYDFIILEWKRDEEQ